MHCSNSAGVVWTLPYRMATATCRRQDRGKCQLTAPEDGFIEFAAGLSCADVIRYAVRRGDRIGLRQDMGGKGQGAPQQPGGAFCLSADAPKRLGNGQNPAMIRPRTVLGGLSGGDHPAGIQGGHRGRSPGSPSRLQAASPTRRGVRTAPHGTRGGMLRTALPAALRLAQDVLAAVLGVGIAGFGAPCPACGTVADALAHRAASVGMRLWQASWGVAFGSAEPTTTANLDETSGLAAIRLPALRPNLWRAQRVGEHRKAGYVLYRWTGGDLNPRHPRCERGVIPLNHRPVIPVDAIHFYLFRTSLAVDQAERLPKNARPIPRT